MKMDLETKRAIVTSLHITIQTYWKGRKSPYSRAMVKQSVKALRTMYIYE